MGLEDLKRVVRFAAGYLQYRTGYDRHDALSQYIRLAKQYEVPEQVDGYAAKYQELKEVLDAMLTFCQTHVDAVCSNDFSCKVLDYGCGSGRYLRLLQNYDIYGVDANRYTLQKHTKTLVPKAKLYAFDLSDPHDVEAAAFLERYRCRFDVICSMTVIQFIRRSRIELWFARIATLLKPNGRIILNFPVPKDLFDRYHVGYIRYTPLEIERLLQKNGCRIVSAQSNIYNQKFDRYQPQPVDYGYNIVAEKIAPCE